MQIKAQNITKQFTEKYILREFSFEINPGDKVNIAGPSGIGKTTLFRLLLGFEMPDSGHIEVNGKALEGEQIWAVRQQVAYVSQDLNIGLGTVNQLFTETLSYKQNHHLKSHAQKHIAQLLEQFELPTSTLDKNITELSGGEKQRVAIVNSLLLQRKVFFLDEISSALDASLKEKVLDYFLGNTEFTVLYISHDSYRPSNIAIKTLTLSNHD